MVWMLWSYISSRLTIYFFFYGLTIWYVSINHVVCEFSSILKIGYSQVNNFVCVIYQLKDLFLRIILWSWFYFVVYRMCIWVLKFKLFIFFILSLKWGPLYLSLLIYKLKISSHAWIVFLVLFLNFTVHYISIWMLKLLLFLSSSYLLHKNMVLEMHLLGYTWFFELINHIM